MKPRQRVSPTGSASPPQDGRFEHDRLGLPLFLTAAVGGCSSSIVGTWKASEAGSQTVLKVESDNTYSAAVTPKDGARKGSTGEWEKEEKNKFRFIQEAGDWPRVVRAELTDKKTLQLFGEGVSTELKKD